MHFREHTTTDKSLQLDEEESFMVLPGTVIRVNVKNLWKTDLSISLVAIPMENLYNMVRSSLNILRHSI